MQKDYNLDSDSDEDDVEAVTAIANSSTWHLHDIEKVTACCGFSCALFRPFDIVLYMNVY